MTRNNLFLLQPGSPVYYNGERGTYKKLSRDKEKLLIKFSNGDICWIPYYLIEI